MNGKQFVIAALFALVLLTVAFIPRTSRQAGSYDAWADINEDGKIDIYDVAYSARLFGTTGDPTKNVTITGHASKVIKVVDGININPGTWRSGLISIDGYAKVTVLVHLPTIPNQYSLMAYDNTLSMWWQVDKVIDFDSYCVRTYDVMNQQIEILVANGDTAAHPLFVDIYLMA